MQTLDDLISYIRKAIRECEKRQAFDKDYKWAYVKGAHEKTLAQVLTLKTNLMEVLV